MHYIYKKENGEYIGAFDDESIGLVVEPYIEGPAPDTAQDKFIDGELIKYVFPPDKKKLIEETIGALPAEKVLPLLDVIAKGKPFMDSGRWDIVAMLADSVQSDDEQVRDVVNLVKSIASA